MHVSDVLSVSWAVKSWSRELECTVTALVLHLLHCGDVVVQPSVSCMQKPARF